MTPPLYGRAWTCARLAATLERRRAEAEREDARVLEVQCPLTGVPVLRETRAADGAWCHWLAPLDFPPVVTVEQYTAWRAGFH